MNEPFEPIDGARVRIKVEVDGRLLIDADLTTVYLRTKYGADDTLMPFHFVPFAPPDEGDEDQTPAAALRGRLRFTIDDNDCPMCQNGTHPTLLQLGRCPNCGRSPAAQPIDPRQGSVQAPCDGVPDGEPCPARDTECNAWISCPRTPWMTAPGGPPAEPGAGMREWVRASGVFDDPPAEPAP